ncbi:MAG TPA: hypothetical protein VE619_10430 [Nitrososphaeraceae archaeon]|nr:hypothetical protein [Nitrososphaeraceae archaeon]
MSYPNQNPNPVPNQNSAVGTKSDKRLSLDDTRRNILVGFRVTKREEAESQDLANELSEFLMDANTVQLVLDPEMGKPEKMLDELAI